MNVFVRRSSLAQDDGAVAVMGFYGDDVPITPEMHRPEFSVLSLPASAIVATRLGGHKLAPGWREKHRDQIAQGEADRRIEAVFPPRDQIRAALELAVLASQHGAGQWPAEAQRRREEIFRIWGYVQAVRQAVRAVTAAPGDLTADTRWPAKIAAYKG